MRGRGILWWLWLLGTAGCMHAPRGWDQAALLPVIEPDQPVAPRELARRLSGVAWSRQPDWQPAAPCRAAGDVLSPGFRWRIGPAPQSQPATGDAASPAGAEPLRSDSQPIESWAWNAEELHRLAAETGPAGDAALILLARFDPHRSRDTWSALAELALDVAEDASPTPMHLAAAEAWCFAASQAGSDADAAEIIEALVAEKRPLALREELFRGLCRQTPPRALLDQTSGRKVPEFQNDFLHAAPTARRAIVEGCVLHAALRRPADASRPAPFDAAQWPTQLAALQWDVDPQMRRLFGQFVALVDHPEALQVLQAQLGDIDQAVREEACVSLGRLHTDAARQTLRAKAAPDQLLTQHVVRGLAEWGEDELEEFTTAPLHAVRMETARQLGRFHTLRSATLLQTMVADATIQVQGAALEAVRPWPDRCAVPVLLQAASEATPRIRRAALEQLAARRGEVLVDFPISADADARRARVAELARAWGVETQLPGRTAPHVTPAGANRAVEAEELIRCLDLVTGNLDPGTHDPAAVAEAREILERLTAADLPMVEALVERAPPTPAAYLGRELLPRLSPQYAALAELENPDNRVRRRAAQQLAEQGAQATLRPLVVRGLRQLLATEQDGPVWRSCMAAIQSDDLPEHVALARLALQHPWPDVRQLGCDYALRHPRGEFASELLAIALDRSASWALRTSAAAGLGQCSPALARTGDPERGLAGLATTLSEPHQEFRVAVAGALSRGGDPQGAQELVHLCHHDHWAVRVQAVQQMGATGRTEFVDDLIRLAWTERNSSVQHAALTALNDIVPPAERPAECAREQVPEKLVKAWAAWAAQRGE